MALVVTAAATLFQQHHGSLLCFPATAKTTSLHLLPLNLPHSITISSSSSSSSTTTSSSSLLQSVFSEREPSMIPVILDRSESIQGLTITISDLLNLVTHLRISNKPTRALMVMQWISSKGTRFHLCDSAMAVFLDLIGKVRGISAAEEFFAAVENSRRGKRTYCSMLNCYARAEMVEKGKLLWEEMRKKEKLLDSPLPFNIMMELYTRSGEMQSVDPLVAEMVENEVNLDSHSYTLWISSQKCAENVGMVYEKLMQEDVLTPHWSILSSMAGVYIKLGDLEKGQRWVTEIEGRMDEKKDIEAYHHLMNLYSGLGKRDEVMRVWKMYMCKVSMVENKGFYVAISSLMKVGDFEGAKKLYYEWLRVKKEGEYECRIGNLFIGWYVRVDGSQEKADLFLQEMFTEEGASANSYTWGLLAEGAVKNGSLREALGFIDEAIKEGRGGLGRGRWKPCPSTIAFMVQVFMAKGDGDERGSLGDLLNSLDCIDKESYNSLVGMK